MHEERRRSGANLYPIYSSDEEERISYANRSKSDKRTRRSASFRDNTPVNSSEYRRRSLVGNKSSNSYLDRQASKELGKTGSEDFDALYIPRAVITIAAGLAAGVFIAVISVSLLQQSERPSYLHGMSYLYIVSSMYDLTIASLFNCLQHQLCIEFINEAILFIHALASTVPAEIKVIENFYSMCLLLSC